MASVPHFSLLKYVCPNCRTVRYINVNDAYKRVKCRKCKSVIIVDENAKIISCKNQRLKIQ